MALPGSALPDIVRPQVMRADLGWFLSGLLILAGVACVVVVPVVLFRYAAVAWAVLWRKEGPADVVCPPEPAYKQYFFRKAFVDYREIVQRSIAAGRGIFGSVSKVTNFFFGKGCGQASFAIFVGAVGGVGIGAVALAGLGLIHLSIVLSMGAVAMTFAYLFRLLEYASMLVRRVFFACPHAGCYRRIALPVYACPGCGVKHQRLIPGPYGTFRRRCSCGQMLPTLFFLGRHRLPSLCPNPHCGRPLNAEIGRTRNLHFPIVGGASAGKSSHLAATVVELSERAAGGRLSLDFPSEGDKRTFVGCRSAFEHGQLLLKTAAFSPTAFLAKISDASGNAALVYTYDAAGELYQGADELHAQEYYAYLSGIIFVIDPFSLPETRQEGGADFFRIQHMVKPSAEDPEAVYGRMVSNLRAYSGVMGRMKKPFAVVLTKTDALGLRERLARDGSAKATSALTRSWLEAHGGASLVRSIDRDFSEVRYFACSALGRLPDPSGRPFAPAGALDPLTWLLGHYNLKLDAG